MAGIIYWLEHHLLPCPYKSLAGLDCPGCGMQRAFVALLQGHMTESFLLYPALLPILFTLLLTAAHLKFRWKNGADYVRYSYCITIGIVILNYLFKMLSPLAGA